MKVEESEKGAERRKQRKQEGIVGEGGGAIEGEGGGATMK